MRLQMHFFMICVGQLRLHQRIYQHINSILTAVRYMAALVEMWKYFEYFRPGEKMEEENIYVLSIGTGKSKRRSVDNEKTAVYYGGKKNWV